MSTTTAPYLDLSLLGRPERIGIAAAVVLLVAIFLPWFSTSGNGRIDGKAGTFNALQTYDWPLAAYLLVCVAAVFAGLWVIARGHELSWVPGELTIVLEATGFVLVLVNGIVLGRPGAPDGTISLKIGYPLALLALLTLTAAALLKTAERTGRRQPPGVSGR